MDDQNGAAVCGNLYAGSLVKGRVFFIASVSIPCQIGCRRGIHGLSDCCARRAAVVIFKRRGAGGIIILFLHIDDRVIDRLAGPLGIQRGIFVDRDRAGDPLRQRLVRIPALEVIAVAGRIRGRQIDAGSVSIGAAGNVAAAVGLIAQLEVLAEIVDVQLLAGSLRDRRALGTLQHRIVKALDVRRNVAVQYALDVFRSVDLAVAVAVQILQQIDVVVHRRKGDVLEANGALLFRVKAALGDGDRLLLRIIDRRARDLIGVGLRRGRSGDFIRQLAGLDLHQVGVEDDLFAAVIEIVIFRGNIVDIDRAEHRHDSHGAGDNGLGVDDRVGAVNDPLLKHLAGDERILRHGADGFARAAEVLGKTLNDGLAVLDDKVNGILIRKLRLEREIGLDLLAARVLRIVDEPADKVFALDHGVGRKLQRVARIVGVGLIDLGAHHELDGEHGLVILGPDVRVGRDLHAVAEVAAAVDPLAAAAGQRRHRRDVVQTIARIDVDRLFINGLRLALVRVEGYLIGDLVIVRDDRRVRRGDIGFVDALYDRGSAVIVDRADSPVGNIVLAGDGCGHIVADGLSLDDQKGLNDLAVAVIEVDPPGSDLVVAFLAVFALDVGQFVAFAFALAAAIGGDDYLVFVDVFLAVVFLGFLDLVLVDFVDVLDDFDFFLAFGRLALVFLVSLDVGHVVRGALGRKLDVLGGSFRGSRVNDGLLGGVVSGGRGKLDQCQTGDLALQRDRHAVASGGNALQHLAARRCAVQADKAQRLAFRKLGKLLDADRQLHALERALDSPALNRRAGPGSNNKLRGLLAGGIGAGSGRDRVLARARLLIGGVLRLFDLFFLIAFPVGSLGRVGHVARLGPVGGVGSLARLGRDDGVAAFARLGILIVGALLISVVRRRILGRLRRGGCFIILR